MSLICFYAFEYFVFHFEKAIAFDTRKYSCYFLLALPRKIDEISGSPLRQQWTVLKAFPSLSITRRRSLKALRRAFYGELWKRVRRIFKDSFLMSIRLTVISCALVFRDWSYICSNASEVSAPLHHALITLFNFHWLLRSLAWKLTEINLSW